MNRAARVAISEETLRIIDAGAYCNANGVDVSIRSVTDEALARTLLFRESDFPAELPTRQWGGATQIEVTDETTLAAAARLSEHEPFVLNFASAKNPGGGFLSGSQAQEESLARASALYPCLMSQFDMYTYNRGRSSALYSDWMIYSPRVPVFRDDDGALLDTPYLTTFLTAPAVNAGAVAQNEPDNFALIDVTNTERARKLLWIANRHGHRVVVLGAWGCGVFRNDPTAIATMFGDLIEGEFSGCFERIVMAIYDRTPSGQVRAAFTARFAA